MLSWAPEVLPVPALAFVSSHPAPPIASEPPMSILASGSFLSQIINQRDCYVPIPFTVNSHIYTEVISVFFFLAQ